MGPTANARIDSEHFSGQDQLSTTQHAGVKFTENNSERNYIHGLTNAVGIFFSIIYIKAVKRLGTL